MSWKPSTIGTSRPGLKAVERRMSVSGLSGSVMSISEKFFVVSVSGAVRVPGINVSSNTTR